MSGVHLGPVGVRGVSGGETREACAGVAATFDLEPSEEGSVAAVVAVVDATADVVVVGTGMTAGVAVMSVAMVTLCVEGADC